MKLFKKKDKKEKKSDSLSSVNSKRSTINESQSQREDSGSDSDESVASSYSTTSNSKNRTSTTKTVNKPKILYNSAITVRILEGKLLRARTDNRAGFDAFIAIKFDNQKRTTRTKKDDGGNPVWNDSVKLYFSDSMDKHLPIEIALVEKDYLGDQVVGSFSYPLSNLTKGSKIDFFVGFAEKSQSAQESGKFAQNEVRFQLFWEDMSQEDIDELDMDDVLGVVENAGVRTSRDHLSKRSTFVSASFQKQKEEDGEFERKKVQIMTDHQDRVGAFETDCNEIRRGWEVREQQLEEREKTLKARLEAAQKKLEELDAQEAARQKKKEEKKRQQEEQQRTREENQRKSRVVLLEGKSGLLAKQGHTRKTWKNRYFIIKGCELHYYTQINETNLKGKINLKGGNVVMETDVDGRPFCFKVIPRDGKEYLISATSEEERSDWADAIRLVAYKFQERVNADTKKT